MDANVVVAPEAGEDIDLAYQWYENQRPGLGRQFLDRFRACVKTISHAPELHEMVASNYRRALMRKFPYAVFYSFADDTVTIYGVIHTARDPAIWKLRLP